MKIKLNSMVLLLLPFYCTGTYTTVAYDSQTGNVGGSGASCVDTEGVDVSITYASVPGIGVVAAQANINATLRDIAIYLVNNGVSAHDIIDSLEAESGGIEKEQYAIITHDDYKTYTGTLNKDWAGNMTGSSEGYTYSFQGNYLTSANVSHQATSAFTHRHAHADADADANTEEEGNDQILQRGCDMAWRLFYATQAGGENGEGDKRCNTTGTAATTTYIRVDLNDGYDTGVFYQSVPGEPFCPTLDPRYPGAIAPMFCDFAQRGYPNAYLSIEISTNGTSDPLLKLDAEFRAWAKANNCHEKENIFI